jgi:hypothetical protein
LSVRNEICHKNSHLLAETFDKLAFFHSSHSYKKSAEYLKKALPIISSIFGENSVEYAGEVLKTAGVCFQGRLFPECRDYVNTLMKLNFVVDSDDRTEIESMNLALQQMGM